MVLTQTNLYESSIIKSSTYDFKELCLTVQFNNNTYIYKGVDPETYNKFVGADSQGSTHNQFIKGKFEFEKIEA
jgi:hypothetical protein